MPPIFNKLDLINLTEMYIDSYEKYISYCLYRKKHKVPSKYSCLLNYLKEQNQLDVCNNILGSFRLTTKLIIYNTPIKLFIDETQI